MSLAKLKNKKGKYAILAIDHRASFKKISGERKKEKITALKQEIIETIGKYASAILLDPVYGKKIIKKIKKQIKKPVLICQEKSGYLTRGKSRITRLAFSVEKSKTLGADAIKLNLFYNPECPAQILRLQQQTAEKVGKQCRKHRILFLLEIITYPFSKKFNKAKTILNSIEEFRKPKYNVAIFKLEYPGSISDCRSITRMLNKPWVLLSAGKSFKQFEKELKIAKKTGCSGFAAGRALWQDALKIKNPEKRAKWLKTKGINNIKKLVKLL